MVNATPRPIYSRNKKTDTPCTEGWVGATACLNVRPVPSCYAVCAVRSTVSTAYFEMSVTAISYDNSAVFIITNCLQTCNFFIIHKIM